MSNRAISEVLGFMLVFSLVVSTVGVVYVTGFQGLSDARNAEQLTNAERAFDVLADNLNDVNRGAAPARTTDLKLSDARLHLEDGPHVNVTVTSGLVGSPTYKRTFDPIVYTDNRSGTQLVYSNGAVLRVDDGGAVVQRRPPMVFRTDGTTRVAVVPVIQTRSMATQSVGGDQSVRVRAEQASTGLLNTASVSGSTPYGLNVSVRTTPERAPAWERYLDEELEANYGVDDPCDRPSPATVSCTFEVDRLYVTVTYVDVALSR